MLAYYLHQPESLETSLRCAAVSVAVRIHSWAPAPLAQITPLLLFCIFAADDSLGSRHGGTFLFLWLQSGKNANVLHSRTVKGNADISIKCGFTLCSHSGLTNVVLFFHTKC